MDVGEWLRRLGLGQYEAAFRDSEIDADVLPELEDQHLKDLGVSLGHRLKILRAIRELAAGEPAKEHPAPEPPQPAEPASQGSAERRHLTVMFCDLVGSTSISAKLDAEDWRDLVGGYLDAASAAVKEMGGHVAKKLGDGIMALFGYPLAQENDAERAVRASLGIQRALAEINAKNAGSGRPELMARIGVETGAVVVDSSGEIFGDAPNVAARVQALSEPGAIFVTAKVQRQVAGLFVAEDRGAQALKGVPEPTVLYRIVRASGGGRRSGQRALTPLVGREEEVAMLLRRWERARQGEGQFVQIVGEPGLGKSRLIEEFRARLVDTPHTWVEWASSQLLQNTPLHPIAEWGRQRFGGADVPAERRLADLESTLQSINLDPTENVPLLAHLLDIPQPPERASKLAPEELRRRQLAALLAWYMAGARVQPAVVAMEDLHWADPTTLDVLRSFADRGAFAPMLVLATTRPEFRAPWDMRSHHGVISLAPLDRRQVARMVGELAAKHALSQAIVEGVNERTGGVPLFVEEVTRLLLERGELGGSQTIPPTLQQSLSARLDRLGPAREVAMIGAVLGRGFSYPLLKAIATPVAAVADRGPTGLNEAGYRGLDEAGLQAALEKLAEADILLVEGLPPQADYRFKHALIQDAAYENLLKSRRQALHRRAAETLRDQFPDRAATQPEVLAHHFTEAGLTDAAIEYWGKAGDQALRRSAFQEAIAHLGKAIEMADQAGVGKASDVAGQRRLHLHVAHGNALFAARGYGAPEATEAFVKARNSEPGDKDAPERLAVDFGLWVGCYYRGELPQMTAYAGSLLNDVRAKPDSTEAGVAHRVRGITHQFAGEYVEARHHLEKALALFQPGRDDDLAFRFGMDAGVVAMLYLALALWPLGDVDRAVSLIERARERIASVMHIGTHANEKLLAAMFELMRGDHPRAAQNAVDLARLARDRDLNLWRAFGVFLEGWAMAKGGTLGQGLEDMRRGADLLREQNVLLFDGLLKIALAEAETGAGDPEHAIVILDEALATADRTGYRAFEAELHRVRGEILLERDQTNPAPAEEALRTAIDVARRQSARSFELRAALSLAKLYQSIGRPVEAHDILAPALEGFSPTPELAEIAEALGLLGALAETDKVEAAVAQRQRRLHLQTAYGQAMMMSKGFGAEETKAAFARAAELAAKADDFAERFAARHGEWTLAMVRGDQRRARELASAFLKEAEDTGRVIEAGVARRGLALICYSSGDFLEARTHCERALDACDPQRDQETRERFSEDTGTVAMSCLALTTWQLGEVERARELIDEANLRARKLGHGPSMANHLMWKSYLENLRGDAAAALIAAEDSGRLGREHGMQFYCVMAELNAAWAHGRLRDATAGAEELRRALAVWADQGGFGDAWFYQTVLAELEAQTLGADNALARIDEALVLAQQVGARGDLAFPHRLRGEILLKRDPSNPAPAEEAFLTAFAIAQQQGARSWGLRAALSLAKLYQSTARPVEAHDVLAPALEGFSPTPELPEIEEAQALLAKLTEAEEVKAAAASRQRRLQLQTSYSKALMLSRGFGSEEAKAAFTLAWELAKGVDDAAERFDAYYGLFIGSQLRAELRLAREIAEKFLCEAEKEARTIEAAAARRSLGTARLYQGDLAQAHAHFEQTLRIYDPERDREAKFRFGTDVGALAMVYLALTNWLLGEAGQARKLGEEAIARAVESAHAPTLANAYWHKALFDVLRDDAEACRHVAESVLEVSRGHGLELYLTFGALSSSWARSRLGDHLTGTIELRQALASYTEQGNKLYVPLFEGLLAEFEAAAQDAEVGLARIDEALALAEQTGERWTDALLHRIRGDILRKVHPDDPAPVAQAWLAAIAVAREQGARSFGLLAAVKLAKLYQSTGRPVEAHDVLAPALEGFSPTPEMPEIAEAQALLAALDETGEVKNAAASRQRRLQLQTSYSKALMLSRGFGSEEAKAGFAHAQELAKALDNAAERFDAYYGLFVGSLLRAELRLARETAEKFLREAEKEARTTEAASACRCLGTACLFQGDLVVARAHFEQALRIFDPERDREAKFRFGTDVGAVATGYLALTNWLLGEAGLARKLIEEAIARAVESAHAPTLALAYWLKALFDALPDDAEAGRRDAESLLEVSRGHGLGLHLVQGALFSAWASARLGDRVTGVTELRQALAAYADQGNKLHAPLFQGRLAEFEAAVQDAEGALARIDEALTRARQNDEHWTDALLHRIRGDILLKADPGNPARAEDAYLAAIAIAREQGARSFGLLAALKLAKLYQSTARPVEAYDILAPALEGLEPTPEMAEIAEGQALLAALARTEAVTASKAARLQRAQLQTKYSFALGWTRGFAAEETRAAIARSDQLTADIDDITERFAAYRVHINACQTGGDFALARQIAETFHREARTVGGPLDVALSRRFLAQICYFQGEFAQARAHLEETVRISGSGMDGEAKDRFGNHNGISALSTLALLCWQIGEVERARELTEQATTRAIEFARVEDIVSSVCGKIVHEVFRGDAHRALLGSETLIEIAGRNGSAFYLMLGTIQRGWARARLDGGDSGLAEFRQAMAKYFEHGNRFSAPLYEGLYAELEAERQSADAALTRIDEASALAQQTGERRIDVLLHRIRGDILCRVHPDDPAPAEQAYLAAIAVAQQQSARSFGLQAAFALAKLYQSTGRPVEAHDVLAPALEGFSPTPEMAEIAEGQALLAELAEKVGATARRSTAKLS